MATPFVRLVDLGKGHGELRFFTDQENRAETRRLDLGEIEDLIREAEQHYYTRMPGSDGYWFDWL